MDITVASLFTATGAGAAALVVRQVIELAKAALPALDNAVSGALQAFVLTAAVYTVAVFGTPAQQTPDGILGAVVAWATCATAAIGIDQAWSRARS